MDLHKLTIARQIKEVKRNPIAIRYIEKPTVKLQLIAVRTDPDIIKEISNPPKSVQMAAVWARAGSIRHIKKPFECVQLRAITCNPFLIREIKEPTEAIQIAAVGIHWGSIAYIKNPSPKIQLLAIKAPGSDSTMDRIYAIKNPCAKLRKKMSGFFIRYWIQEEYSLRALEGFLKRIPKDPDTAIEGKTQYAAVLRKCHPKDFEKIRAAVVLRIAAVVLRIFELKSK